MMENQQTNSQKMDQQLVEQFKLAAVSLRSNGYFTQLHGMEQIRNFLLSQKDMILLLNHPQARKYIQGQLMDKLLFYLRKDHVMMAFDSLLIIVSLTKDSQCCAKLIEEGIAYTVIYLFTKSVQINDTFRMNLLWVLNNIAEKIPSFTTQLIEAHAVPLLIQIIRQNKNYWIIQQAITCLSKVVKNSSCKIFDLNKQAVQTLVQFFISSKFQKIGKDGQQQILISLASLSQNGLIIDQKQAKIIQKLYECVKNYNFNICYPALITLGNFIIGSYSKIQKLIQLNFFGLAFYLVTNPDPRIVCKCITILKYISSGNYHQKQLFLQSQKLINALGHILTYKQPNLKLTIYRIFINLISKKAQQPKLRNLFLQLNLIQSLPRYNSDSQHILNQLQILNELLVFGNLNHVQKHNMFLEKFIQTNGRQYLLKLNLQGKRKVTQIVSRILSSFFPNDLNYF